MILLNMKKNGPLTDLKKEIIGLSNNSNKLCTLTEKELIFLTKYVGMRNLDGTGSSECK